MDGSRPVEVVLFPPSRRLGDGDAGRSRARADVIDEGVVDGSWTVDRTIDREKKNGRFQTSHRIASIDSIDRSVNGASRACAV